MSIEQFILHEERKVLDTVNNEIHNKEKEFFSKIESIETKEKIKSYLTFLSEQKINYFENNKDGINKFEEDKINFLSENSDFDENSFDALILSIIKRKHLLLDIEKENLRDNFDGGDLEGHSKEIEELYKKFIKEQGNYNELLYLPREVRIKLCTSAKINIEDVMDGEVGSLTFDFKFGKEKINKEIYLNTTAGQLLPAEVQQVIKGGVVYFRSGQLGEFFTENNKRLTIHQGTHITVSKLQTREDVLTNRENIKKELNIEDEKNISLEDFIKLEAKLRGIDSKFALIAFKDSLEKTPKEKQKYVLENMLTEFDRIRGYYRLSGKVGKIGKYEDRLALEVFSQFGGKDWKEKAKKYGIKEKYIEDRVNMISTNINMEDVIDSEITQDMIDKISKMKRFRPGSKEAIILFKIACKIAGIDKNWAENPHLHKIMSNESGGKVGIINYTLKGMSQSEFKNGALNGTISDNKSASGLGQLKFSNVDRLYPSGRKGIGDPIEEAVGFIKYIRERYGDPDTAGKMWGHTGSYYNSHRGKTMRKTFKEGY